jgi:signal transduction histidine kinase
MIHRSLELHRLDDAEDSLLIMSEIDVVEFCRGIFETFKENNPHKTFVFHSSFARLRVEADAIKFESAITNLLSNACKYLMRRYISVL